MLKRLFDQPDIQEVEYRKNHRGITIGCHKVTIDPT